MMFSELGLCAPILKAVTEQGYQSPSPIQAQAIPAVLKGQDLMAAAQTGTGKTAGFTLPMLERLSQGEPSTGRQIRALVLTPTRELAAQVGDSVASYSKYLPLRSTVVFGGVSINPQMQRLQRGIDILVATPGRLLDLHQNNAVNFSQLEILVLDEADRMLDMGFIHDIKCILNLLPGQRQNLLFSATFSQGVRKLAHGLVNDPVEISVSPRNSTAKTVQQHICPVDKKRKAALFSALLAEHQWHQVLVFTRTKRGANQLCRHLEADGVRALAIHGNKSQAARTKALNSFKSGRAQVLVATDIAARGLDIDQLPQVVNFDLPDVAEDYVHRIGRTGRAGAQGQALSLVSADEFDQLSAIEKLIGRLLEREEIPGFEPSHRLPESSLKPQRRQKQPKRAQEHRDGQRSSENSRGHKPTGKNKRHHAGKQGTQDKNKSTSPRGKPPTQPKRTGSNSDKNQHAQKRSANNQPRSGNAGNTGKPQSTGRKRPPLNRSRTSS